MSIKLKRIYDESEKDDGVRILVDRLWPRGISKEKANLDHWLKEIGPSNDLRKWFNHDAEKYEEFCMRYREELKDGLQSDELERLRDLVNNNEMVTLLFGAKDEEHNQAVVLKGILE